FAHYQPFIRAGTITRAMEIEVVVALVTVTLFIPCIANFFMMVKERGWKTAAAIMGFIVPFSFGVAAPVNLLMRRFYSWPSPVSRRPALCAASSSIPAREGARAGVRWPRDAGSPVARSVCTAIRKRVDSRVL